MILDGFGDGFVAFDRDWTITYCNPAAEAYAGLTREAALGRVYWAAVPSAVGSAFEAAFRKAMTERVSVSLEVPSAIHPGATVAVRAFPIEGGLGISFGDITRRKAQEAELRDSEARFRAVADSAPAPIWMTSAEGPIEFVNQAFAEFFGRPADQLTGDIWAEVLHPDDLLNVANTRASAAEGPRPYWVEARVRRADGQWRWTRTSSSPRFGAGGLFEGYVGIAMDMTEVRAAEERQQLLINELNHRVKNTLSTIQSIAHQTFREGSVTRLARTLFTERLLALSTAHNVLTRESWESAQLSQIAAEAVRPYDEASAPRIAIAGPAVRVGPNVSLALSMAFHELATNATKYGALSVPDGRVAVDWTLSRDGKAARIVWRETGGPPVKPPQRKGFGSRLLAQGLIAELGHGADLTYDPNGLICTVTAPVAEP